MQNDWIRIFPYAKNDSLYDFDVSSRDIKFHIFMKHNDWIRFETCTIFRNASQNHAETAKWMTRYTDI